MKDRGVEETDLLSVGKRKTYPVKIQKLGDLIETLGVETFFGIAGIFKVRAVVSGEYEESIGCEESLEYGEKNTEVETDGTVFILNKKEGTTVTVQAFKNPSYHDMSTYLSILKCVERHSEGINSDSGFNVRREGKVLRESYTTKIEAGKREFCRILGIKMGANTFISLKGQLYRLHNTVITIKKHSEVLNTFKLIDKYEADGGRVAISVNNKIIDMCQSRNHRIHWEAIRALKGQVEKGLLIYLDCHNYGSDDKLWEHMIIRFLYGVKRPEFVEQGKGDITKALEKMRAYEKECVEYRRQIKNAFKVLEKEGLIKEWSFRDKDENGMVTSKHFLVDQGFKKSKIAEWKLKQIKKVKKNNVVSIKKNEVSPVEIPDCKVTPEVEDELIPF